MEQGVGCIWKVAAEPYAYSPTVLVCSNSWSPKWSPDSLWIAFLRHTWNARSDSYDSDIYVIHSDGGNARRLTHSGGNKKGLTWTEQGDTLLYYAVGEGIFRVSVETGEEVRTWRQ